MQAPDVSLGEVVRRCRQCGEELPIHPGRGRHAYCPPPRECVREARRDQVRKAVRRFNDGLSDDIKNARQNAYRFIRREGLTRRDFWKGGLTGTAILLLGGQCETWPDSTTARHEETAKTLEKLREALLRGDRHFVIHGSLALQALLRRDNSAFAFRVQTHCKELLRDAGEVGDWSVRRPDSDRAFARAESLALTIEKRWAAAGDRLRLVGALLTRASLYRQREGGERDAMELVKGAEYILRGLSLDKNRKLVNILLHQTLSWRVRLKAFYLREVYPESAEQDFKRLYELAEQSGSPITSIVTARDEGAFWALSSESDRAQSILREARSRFETLLVPSAIADLSLRRSEVELAVRQDPEEAIRQVREYGRIWQRNPTAAQLKALRTLEAKCRVNPAGTAELPRVYSTAILAELWMDERLTAL